MLALRLLFLTAVRPGELRNARWNEFDVEAGFWRIPAVRMKMKREHLVPMSEQALIVINEVADSSLDRECVFPSPFYPGKSVSDGALNSARAVYVAMTRSKCLTRSTSPDGAVSA